MILIPQTLIQIVASGGGVTIDLDKNLLMSQTMIQVAAAGRGNVIFDLS